MPPTVGLRVRKLADTSKGTRVVRYNPETGEKQLVNPATGEPEPWPFGGLVAEGELPDRCRVSTTFVERGVKEGWIELEGERVAHRRGGSPERPWTKTHTFIHADALVLKLVDGDARYEIVHQPDKYVDSTDPTDEVTDEVYAAGETRVDWFYDLELED